MTSDLQQLLDRSVQAGVVPGAVGLLSRGETEVVNAGAIGAGGAPMRADAIMRIQSMTKVVTAVAALRLVEAGRLELDQPVEAWLPEVADSRVLSSPTADLDDTVPAERPITLRHLLTNTAGWGMVTQESPLQRAMAENGTQAGAEPVSLGADEWLVRLAELPLAFQPGAGWRYHHSFGVLGVLLSRVTGRPLGEHLEQDLFEPLGMVDTGFWVPEEKLDRLPAAYRHGDDGLVETEPAGGGFYAGPPPFDVSHAELVSTARDYHRFLTALLRVDEVISAEHRQDLTSDQVSEEVKTPESFFPGFWDGMGWGFGVGVQTAGPHQGRWGWSGGQGTDFFVDPDGTIGILLTQVELGGPSETLIKEFQSMTP